MILTLQLIQKQSYSLNSICVLFTFGCSMILWYSNKSNHGDFGKLSINVPTATATATATFQESQQITTTNETSFFPFYIFQIGFHKTGTRTLYSFFMDNNVNSVHYNQFSLLSQNSKVSLPSIMTYAYFHNESILGDMPYYYQYYGDFGLYPGTEIKAKFSGTAPWYKILLQQYPFYNFKFILNIRNINHWLKSRYFHANGFMLNAFKNNDNSDNSFTDNDDIEIDVNILFLWKKQWYQYMCNLLKFFKENNLLNDLIIYDIENEPLNKIIDYFAKFNLTLNEKKEKLHIGGTRLEKKSLTRLQKWQNITHKYPQFLLNDGDDGIADEYHRIMYVCTVPIYF